MEVIDYNSLLDCDIVTYLHDDVYDIMIVDWKRSFSDYKIFAYSFDVSSDNIDKYLLKEVSHLNMGIAKREFGIEFKVVCFARALSILKKLYGKREVYTTEEVKRVFDYTLEKVNSRDEKSEKTYVKSL